MKSVKILLLSVVAAILTSCGTTSTVPITGRKQNLLVSDEQVLSLSNQQYQEYMASAKKSTNATNTALVKRVGQNLANAVVSYLNANGLGAEVSQYQWEFNLVQDTQINAFCMPGGKIVVYEGLLPVTQDEASLAIVLGHEIAHAVAKHSAERLSNAYRQQYGIQVLGAVASGMGASSSMVQLGQIVAGAGGQFFTAGFSRKQESEADHMGLVFAAMAGYDPSVAVGFWQRMSQATGGGSSSLLSDHPSDAERISDIQKWIPEAKKYYRPATAATTTTTTTSSKKKKTTKTIKIK
ncbi:MAG: M48 family metallopeptidase [Prevotella sp.]|jgi:predicted Zn-dependent protease|nr:M48 family metallopeptidase [Prevotella sp.]